MRPECVDTLLFRRRSLIPLPVNVARLGDLLPTHGGSDSVGLLRPGHCVAASSSDSWVARSGGGQPPRCEDMRVASWRGIGHVG